MLWIDHFSLCPLAQETIVDQVQLRVYPVISPLSENIVGNPIYLKINIIIRYKLFGSINAWIFGISLPLFIPQMELTSCFLGHRSHHATTILSKKLFC